VLLSLIAAMGSSVKLLEKQPEDSPTLPADLAIKSDDSCLDLRVIHNLVQKAAQTFHPLKFMYRSTPDLDSNSPVRLLPAAPLHPCYPAGQTIGDKRTMQARNEQRNFLRGSFSMSDSLTILQSSNQMP
jgi:hypothetical protein